MTSWRRAMGTHHTLLGPHLARHFSSRTAEQSQTKHSQQEKVLDLERLVAPEPGPKRLEVSDHRLPQRPVRRTPPSFKYSPLNIPCGSCPFPVLCKYRRPRRPSLVVPRWSDRGSSKQSSSSSSAHQVTSAFPLQNTRPALL